jgi:hypothetical protein
MLLGFFNSLISVFCVVDWSSDNRLTIDEGYDQNPSVIQTQNGTIFVFWASDRRLMQYDIFFKTSADNGLNWTDPTPLTLTRSLDHCPSAMQTKNGSIWVFWQSMRTGNNEIFYTSSPTHGEFWNDFVQLTNSSYSDTNPSASQSVDGTICVVWQRYHEGNYDLFYKISSDQGFSWSNATQLTTHNSVDVAPSITYTWNGTLWVAWTSHRNGVYDIYYKTSADNGQTWTIATPLVTSGKYDTAPSIMQAPDGSMWLIWTYENTDLYYKTSPDYGLSWTPETKLPLDDSGDDTNPSATGTKEGQIWLVWDSVRTDNYDVFYKIANITIHDVVITSVTPSTTTVYKGEEVSIEVVAENQGTENETIEVNCYVNSTSLGSKVIDLTSGTATTLIFYWDTLNFQCGTYTISANASIVPGETVPNMDDNFFTDGTVEVDIPDLNEDGIVDLLDLYIVIVAFGTLPGMPDWDPRADLAEPAGLIDGRDLIVIVDHFGQTY